MSFASRKEIFSIGSEKIQVRHYDSKLFSLSNYAQYGVSVPKSIEASVPKRQAEFLAGRLAARDALEAIQFHNLADISIGRFREPVWPQGVIGGISHTNSIAISLAKHRKSDTIVGLDIENIMNENLCTDIEPMLISDKENKLLRMVPLPRVIVLSVLFSAKESLFKAIFPKVRQYMSFQDSELTHFSTKQQTLGLRMVRKLDRVSFRDQYIVHFCIFDNKTVTLLT